MLVSDVESESCSVVSDSLWPHGLYSPWNAPGQNTGVGSLSLLQGLFPTQGLNPGLPHCRWILYQLSHQGRPQVSMCNWIISSSFPAKVSDNKVYQLVSPITLSLGRLALPCISQQSCVLYTCAHTLTPSPSSESLCTQGAWGPYCGIKVQCFLLCFLCICFSLSLEF